MIPPDPIAEVIKALRDPNFPLEFSDNFGTGPRGTNLVRLYREQGMPLPEDAFDFTFDDELIDSMVRPIAMRSVTTAQSVLNRQK